MSSLAVKLLRITVFIIATVALFLNINSGVGLSSDQRVQLSINVNQLNALPSSYALYLDNVTINTHDLRSLSHCTDYVETHIPVVQYFDTTIVIDTSSIETQLASLLVTMEGGGTVTAEQTGHVHVTETNATLQYAREYIVFGNAPLHYVAIETGTLMTATQNGTVALTFNGWSPSIGLSGSTGYDAIYDTNQLDIQSALPVIRVQKNRYMDNGAIIVGESAVAINVGDSVAITKRLQL